jgi:hypothetical protein
MAQAAKTPTIRALKVRLLKSVEAIEAQRDMRREFSEGWYSLNATALAQREVLNVIGGNGFFYYSEVKR